MSRKLPKQVRRRNGKLRRFCRIDLNDRREKSMRRRDLLKICGSRPTEFEICRVLIEDVWHGPADTEPRIPRSWRKYYAARKAMGRGYVGASELLTFTKHGRGYYDFVFGWLKRQPHHVQVP